MESTVLKHVAAHARDTTVKSKTFAGRPDHPDRVHGSHEATALSYQLLLVNSQVQIHVLLTPQHASKSQLTLQKKIIINITDYAQKL